MSPVVWHRSGLPLGDAGGAGRGVLLGRHVAEGAVQVLAVVLGPETLEQHAGVGEAPELVLVEALVAQAGAERLAEAVLPGLAGAMWKVSVPLSSSQSTTSEAMNSPPLSDLMTAGAPWAANRSARTAFTVRAVME